MKKIFRIGIVLISGLFPSAALAVCSSTAQAGALISPVVFCNIQEFVAAALKALVMVAIPLIGFFFVVVGFKFIAAQGNPGKLAEARKNFVYVIIGAALVLGAWVLATLIGATVSQLTG